MTNFSVADHVLGHLSWASHWQSSEMDLSVPYRDWLLHYIGRRSSSPLEEAPASILSYCGGFPTKYPQLLWANSRLSRKLPFRGSYPLGRPSSWTIALCGIYPPGKPFSGTITLWDNCPSWQLSSGESVFWDNQPPGQLPSGETILREGQCESMGGVTLSFLSLSQMKNLGRRTWFWDKKDK